MDYSALSKELIRHMMRISAIPMQKHMDRFVCGEMFVLLQLNRAPGSLPSELAKSSGTSTAHIAKILRNLQAKGEITRQPDPDDRRRVTVLLTDAGLERIHRATEHMLGEINKLMDHLGESDAQELVRIIGRIAEMKTAY